MKLLALALLSLILMLPVASCLLNLQSEETREIGDVKVLILISNGFGWNYFDAKERLEAWGVNVTTISNSLDTNVPSCYNKPPRGTIADLLIKDVEDDIASQFDALLIPSGGQWQNLMSSSRVCDFISNAYEMGLFIAGICVGNRVVAASNNIVNGTNIVSTPFSNTNMILAGAIIRSGYGVVIDNRIITGEEGGGVSSGGYTEAPTNEVCTAIVREALGYSYVKNIAISPLTGESGTNFSITAEITDLDDELDEILTTNLNITEVVAKVYIKENRTLIETIELHDEDLDSFYTGSLVCNTESEYVIDIEIEDTNSTLVVERELASFIVADDSTTSITNTTTTNETGLDLFVVSLIGLSGAVIFAVVVIIMKRQR